MSKDKHETSDDNTREEIGSVDEKTVNEQKNAKSGDEEYQEKISPSDVENNGSEISSTDNGIIPELHDDVFKAPFKGYDTSKIGDISDAVGEISTEAGIQIKKVHQEKQSLSEKIETLEDQLQQNKKEFQKYKQRKNSETKELKDTATKSFIKDALPIRDDLERALSEENTTDDIRSGVKLIKQNFDELLKKEGVNLIQPEFGDEIDPERHKVMSRVASDAPDGTIVECFRTGYEFDDLIIRPARVTVSKSK